MRTSCSLVVLASLFFEPLTLDAHCFPLAALNCSKDLTDFDWLQFSVKGLLGPGSTRGNPLEVLLGPAFP